MWWLWCEGEDEFGGVTMEEPRMTNSLIALLGG